MGCQMADCTFKNLHKREHFIYQEQTQTSCTDLLAIMDIEIEAVKETTNAHLVRNPESSYIHLQDRPRPWYLMPLSHGHC
jgi:hypothetical protein